MIVSENYLDPDVAYVLGLISAKGRFHQDKGDRMIIIEFPFTSLYSEGITVKHEQSVMLDLAVNQIRDRLDELVESKIQVTRTSNIITMTMRFVTHSIMWRVVKYHFPNTNHYHEFKVPQSIIEGPDELVREFVRGFADATGYIRQSNYDRNNKRRVYLEIANRNWLMPIQICSLLQRRLGIPVQMVQWGHPNTREPNKAKKGTTWAREHQVKIYAEAFLPVGFYIGYKQQILEEFAKDDLEKYPGSIRVCNPNPKVRRINNRKPEHPEENNEAIPDAIRGNHYNAYWQICVALGCAQCVKVPKTQKEFFDDDEE